MIYGLCGASGTGKTTLAAAVADAMSMEFVKTSITDLAHKAGFSPVAGMSLGERLTLQEALLVEFDKLLDGLKGPVILDRTPIDLIGYLFAEIGMQSHLQLSVEERAQVASYALRCQDLARRRMHHIFMVQPLPVYENSATRPIANPGYQWHTQFIMTGALLTADPHLPFSILYTTDLEERVCAVTESIEERLNAIDEMKRTSLHIH